MQTLTVNAYAKINLTLEITGRRDDGYHTLRMVMQSVTLHDTVSVTRLSDSMYPMYSTRPAAIRLTCSNPVLPTDAGNLAYRAAALFADATGIPLSCAIHLEKRIPVAAGLAGGSTDAAAVLHALNQLYQAGLTLDGLCAIGLRLGADVPYCLHGGTMLAEGIGEQLTRLPALPPCRIVLCKPAFSVSAADAYRAFDRRPCQTHPDTDGVCRALADGDFAGVCHRLSNHLEAVAPGQQELSAIKAVLLENGASGALMSGSGPTVYGLFTSEDRARSARDALAVRWRDVFLEETV